MKQLRSVFFSSCRRQYFWSPILSRQTMHAVLFSDDRDSTVILQKPMGSCLSVNGWFQRQGRQPFSTGSALNTITNFRIEILSSEASSRQISGIPPSIDTFPASAKCQQEFRP